MNNISFNIVTSSYVFKSVIRNKNWNSFGISKRYKIYLKEEYINYFNLINFTINCIETGGIFSPNIKKLISNKFSLLM